MGYKLDFEVEKEYIDSGPGGIEYYASAIKATGNSISDVVCLEQDGQHVGFTIRQFREFIEKLKESSIRLELDI